MIHFIPELFVLVLFLAGDLLWDGMASAAAGAAAGFIAFLVLLLFRRWKPALIAEGLIFGGVTALGEIIAFPGGTLILMELVLGLILLCSALFRWKVLARMTGGLGKGLLSQSRSEVLTVALGAVFTVHAVVYVFAEAAGAGGILSGVLLFAFLYWVALRLSSERIRKEDEAAVPVLIRTGESQARLVTRDRVLGSMVLSQDSTGTAAVHTPSSEVPAPEFMRALQLALKSEGYRLIVISGWPGDEIELELDGFTGTNGVWRKRLR